MLFLLQHHHGRSWLTISSNFFLATIQQHIWMTLAICMVGLGEHFWNRINRMHSQWWLWRIGCSGVWEPCVRKVMIITFHYIKGFSNWWKKLMRKTRRLNTQCVCATLFEPRHLSASFMHSWHVSIRWNNLYLMTSSSYSHTYLTLYKINRKINFARRKKNIKKCGQIVTITDICSSWDYTHPRTASTQTHIQQKKKRKQETVSI